MDSETPHYIEWVKLMDGDGKVLGEASFQATDEKVEAVFDVSPAPARLVAHERCNLHGIWMEQVDVT